jgi:LysM repeat protein
MKSKNFFAALTLSFVLISATTVNAVTTAPINSNHYTVQYGDTLYKLSVKFNISLSTLIKINGIQNPDSLTAGQDLLIKEITTVNYVVKPGDTLWGIAQKYNTSQNAIMQSNFLVVDWLMPNQTLTVPVNSAEIVKPVGITVMKTRKSSNFGDIYTWQNAMRLWTTGTKGTLKDLATGKTFNVKYYGGSNHSDIVPLTKADTAIMTSVFGSWSWVNKRPMVLYFTKGGVNYQMSCSLIGMPHSTTDIPDNGMNGQCCLYFYNSVGHSNPVIDPTSQANVLKANGQ